MSLKWKRNTKRAKIKYTHHLNIDKGSAQRAYKKNIILYQEQG